MNVYFDNAATTAIRKEVIDKMTLTMNEIYGNPSSTHSFGRKSKVYLENARKSKKVFFLCLLCLLLSLIISIYT